MSKIKKMADNFCKYYKMKKQVSYDSGGTWSDVYPYEYQKGELYESYSQDCGVVTLYRWVVVPNDYECVLTTKYTKEKKQVSYDNAQNWYDVSPAEYRTGSVIEFNSEDCGYNQRIYDYFVVPNEYICLEGVKYQQRQKYYSDDNGVTWEILEPYEIELGNVISLDSNDCEYNPGYYESQFFMFEAIESGTFKYTGTSGNTEIQYSLDSGQTWISLSSDTQTPTVQSGNEIWWKGNLVPMTANGITMSGTIATYEFEDSGIGYFSATGRFNVKGNIMSLLYADDFIGKTSLYDKKFAFYDLFFGSSEYVRNIENLVLPATSLGDYCYVDMFFGCVNLTSPTSLPATTVDKACYMGMFAYCTSLLKAPILPASTLKEYCYSSMFGGCSSLPTLEPLSATTMAFRSCQNMFSDCKSLNNIQNLLSRVSTLAPSCCDSMFRNCTSLTVAPDLLAARLENTYNGYDWFYCYLYMFKGCENLSYIKMMATQSIKNQSVAADWVNGVAENGTFVKKAGVDIKFGNMGIPSGWTVQNV